jgi:putative tryptophan/tyrosine transport system substrate-binding protein
MNRRDFITLLGGATVARPLAARAQQDQRVRRIGVLMGDFPENNPEARAVVAAFREGLQQLGWTEGRNIRIVTRWAAADLEAMQRYAKELVGSQPELIFSTNTPATATLLQQTRTIPIVFVQVTDPVGSGMSIVSSRARSRASFRSRPRSSSNWRSISRPPRRSASKCLCSSSSAPTMLSNEDPLCCTG